MKSCRINRCASEKAMAMLQAGKLPKGDPPAMAEIAAQTGVEMEALTGVQVALLIVWDLVKPVNPALEITGVRLLYKSGGKSGVWQNPLSVPAEVEQWIAELIN